MTRARLAPYAPMLALTAGLVAANVVRVHAVALAGTAAVAVAVVGASASAARLALVGVVLLLLAWWWASVRLDDLDRSALLAQVGRAERAVVVVTATPRRGKYTLRAPATTRRFGTTDVSERVQLELPLGRAPPQGSILEALCVVEFPRGPSHGFDERTWLRRHGVHVVLRVDEWRAVGRRGGVGGLADRLREQLRDAIAPGLAGERRAVLEGIVLGDDDALPDGLKTDFRRSGLYHLLAVSGQNVVFVGGGALLLAWLLGIPRWIGELGALASIGAYVLAVGPQPSVIRAGVAGALASLAWLAGRLRDAWHVLLLGAVVLLAWNPYLVYDPGFQLSFAAVAAIFTLAPPLLRRLEGYPLPKFVRGAVAISTACGVVTAPILWAQFHALPLLGVVANVLAEPAIPVLLGLAFVTAGLESVSPSAARVTAAVDGLVAEYVAVCARAVSAIPFAQARGFAALVALAVTLAVAAYAWRRWQKR